MLFRRLLFASVAMLVWTGCIEYSEGIHLHTDGSATIRIELRVAPALVTVVQRNPAFRPLAILMDESRMAENLPPGLDLRRHHRVRTSGRQIFINEVYAGNVRNIRPAESPVFTGQRFSVEERDDGTIRYHRVVDFSQLAQNPEFAEMLGQNRMGMSAMLQRAPFRFTLSAPLGIEATNGTLEEGTVSWQYPLGDLLKAPVEQEITFAAPTTADYLRGFGRALFQPRIFPFLALLFLGLFFLATRRPKPAVV